MVKMFRVGIAIFLALVSVTALIAIATVAPAWAVAGWTQEGSDINGEAAGDSSGHSVSLSSDGSRVAIGAWGNDNGGSDAGQVRVYDLTEGEWVQIGSDINGEAAGDYSGYSVSLSSDGSRVAIGALGNDNGGNDAGQVRVFSYSDSGGGNAPEDLAATGGDDASGIALGGAIVLAAGVGIYALRRRGAQT